MILFLPVHVVSSRSAAGESVATAAHAHPHFCLPVCACPPSLAIAACCRGSASVNFLFPRSLCCRASVCSEADVMLPHASAPPARQQMFLSSIGRAHFARGIMSWQAPCRWRLGVMAPRVFAAGSILWCPWIPTRAVAIRAASCASTRTSRLCLPLNRPPIRCSGESAAATLRQGSHPRAWLSSSCMACDDSKAPCAASSGAGAPCGPFHAWPRGSRRPDDTRVCLQQ